MKQQSLKERLDKLLIFKGHAASREEAQGLILAGAVLVEGQKVEKAGIRVPAASHITLKASALPQGGGRYVSRGGLKLEEALDHFRLDPGGMIGIDVGASTGGFTDCLLQRGIRKVYAIDVGYGQMAWKLRVEPRVKILERTHILRLSSDSIPELADLVTIDVSFISLRKVLAIIPGLLGPSGSILALIKPQFELGRGEVGKGGIVRDPVKRKRAVSLVLEESVRLGLRPIGVMPSSVHGRDGNIESFVLLNV